MTPRSYLLLTPFLPYPPDDGGRIRCFEFARGLAERHRVSLLALTEPSRDSRESAAALRDLGLDVETVAHQPTGLTAVLTAFSQRRSVYTARFRSQPFAQALVKRLSRHRYDVVQCEFLYMAQYRPQRPRPEIWLLDEHNVEYRLSETLLGVRSGLSHLPYRLYGLREASHRRREEVASCRVMDHVITTSQADLDLLRSHIVDLRATVVPNGVDLTRYSPGQLTFGNDPPTAVFIGKMDYVPNIDGALWLCREVMPIIRRDLPSFRLAIVGKNPTPQVRALGHSSDVEVTGTVADTRPYLERATVALVPLRAGGGTRLKVLEALAAGCPVVSTTHGCQGIGVEHGRHVLLADSPARFAESVVELARAGGRRRDLARAARRLVQERYGWPGLVQRLERVHEALIEDRPRDVP